MGYVVRADGSPAPGAEVLAVGSDDAPRTRTSGAGAFSLEVEPGYVQLSVRHGGESTSVAGVVAHTGQTHDLGVLRLSSGATLEGIVRSRQGPVMDATVALSPFDRLGDVDRAYTAADGRFSLQGLAPGAYDVAVTASGHTEHVLKGVNLRAGERFALEVLLQGAGSVQGTVRRRGGAPLEGIRVTGGRRAGGPFVGPVPGITVTDAQGAFQLSELEVGTTRIDALRSDGTPAATTFVEVSEDQTVTAELLLDDEGELRGDVRRRDGSPVAGARVVALILDDRRQYESKTNGRGEFSLLLPAGDYKVAAMAPGQEGFADDEIRDEVVRPGAVTQVSLVVLDRDAPFASGVALEPWGSPVVGGFVSLTEPGQPAKFHYGVNTDNEGRFQIPREASLASLEVFDLRVQQEGRMGTLLGVRAGAQDLRIQLGLPGRIEGRVQASPPPSRFEVSISYPGELNFQSPTQVFLGPEFTLSAVRPGNAVLIVVSPDGRRAQAPVEIHADQTTRVDLTLRAAGVARAALVDAHSGAPIEGGRVAEFPEVNAVAGGVVEVPGLPEGAVTLTFLAEGYLPKRVTASIESGVTTDLGAVALARPQLQARGH